MEHIKFMGTSQHDVEEKNSEEDYGMEPHRNEI
jgi:hypothetical protein